VQTSALSENAVALRRFRVKKWPLKVRERDLAAYQELIDAGIMASDGDDFRFTDEGWENRGELLRDAQDRIQRERLEPPDASNLSEAAKALLRACIAGNCPDGDETNRPAYGELVKARIMIPMGSFIKGNERVFRFTYWGWKRRFEFAQMTPPHEKIQQNAAMTEH
jgi:hypothetical protein